MIAIACLPRYPASLKKDTNSYFVVELAGQFKFQWFEEAPDLPRVGRIVLVMRPTRILDEEVTKNLWQIDE